MIGATCESVTSTVSGSLKLMLRARRVPGVSDDGMKRWKTLVVTQSLRAVFLCESKHAGTASVRVYPWAKRNNGHVLGKKIRGLRVVVLWYRALVPPLSWNLCH